MTHQRFQQDPVDSHTEAMRRTRAGAAWLDEKLGPAWDQNLNLDRLNIRSPLNYILSQQFRKGHFSLPFIGLQQAVNCGFSCGIYDAIFWLPLPALNRSYRRLTQAWKLLLQARRDNRPEADHTKRLVGDAERQKATTAISQAV